MNKKIKILHLEDSPNDSDLIQSLIESGNVVHDYFLVDTEKDFLNILETENIDIILSDYSLPDFNGNEALAIVREKYAHLPFIFVSGAMGEDAAINAMLNGAKDYVLKNRLERLVPAIKRAINEHEHELRRKHAEEALHESERKYKDLINEVNDGYFVTDPKGLITFANISLAKILGFKSPDELTGQFFAEPNRTNLAREVHFSLKSIIENKKKVDGVELEVLHNDGNSIHIEVKVVPVMQNGEIAGMQGVIHDITERKMAEINLKEKSELIKAQNAKYIQINKELEFQNLEKGKRAAELIIANKELVFQNQEKEKRAAELNLANIQLAHETRKKEKRAAELIIANIQKAEAEKYKFIIEEKNRNITDSIYYAKRIQQAKLPRTENIFASFPQSFVLFKPKDIVSGDFYFFHQSNDSAFIAASDCTGHGVPGALLSMIGSDKLMDAVSKSSDTSEILNQLNKGIKNSLHQSDSDESLRDGMDLALCSVNTENNILNYAGANRPLWIIRKGNHVLEEIKATKKAIGGRTENDQHFASHELALHQGDTFYIATDGYADQFGGHRGKKLMTRRFKEMLTSIQEKSMQEQEKHLDDFIENWKANVEQLDDILVIGVRI